jgi:transcriptional regulator with XRE-family HTH domain
VSTPQERLGQKLRALREFAGLSTRELAQAVRGTKGLSQSMITRIEGGRLPTRPQIQAWAKATGADRETRGELVEEAEAIYTQVRAWRELDESQRHLQGEVFAKEQASHTVRNYQPFIIPGLLQTQPYAETVLPLIDVMGRFDHPATVAGRMERQRALLEPGRTFQFLIGESAFYFNPGISRAQFREQISRVAMLAALDTVDLAILPRSRTGVGMALANFVIAEGEDDVYGTVELPHADVRVSDDADVAPYRRIYERLWGAAVRGEEAISLVQRVEAELYD